MSADSEELYQADKERVNAALEQSGVNHTVEELYENPDIGQQAVPVLLAQLAEQYETRMLTIIIQLLFRRSLNGAQRERVIQTCLQLCRTRIKEPGPWVELMAGNDLANNVGSQHVGKVGEMFLDKSLGERRDVLARPLGEVGNEEAISYLRAGAKDAETANAAIRELSRLVPAPEAIQICDEALALVTLRFRKHVGEMRAKLERKLKKRKPTHLTNETPPPNSEEWSANLDNRQLPRVLSEIRKCVDKGFGKAEAEEVVTVVDAMSPDDLKRLRFEIRFMGIQEPLWIQISCDDEDAFDFHIFGAPEIIARLQSEIWLE